MPAEARARNWPVRFDHCFQRILLDHAAQGPWYESVEGRPAYRHACTDLLDRAVRAGEAALDGTASLREMNDASLAWRRAAKAGRR